MTNKNYMTLDEIWERYGPCEILCKTPTTGNHYLIGKSNIKGYIIESCYFPDKPKYWRESLPIRGWLPYPNTKPLNQESTVNLIDISNY